MLLQLGAGLSNLLLLAPTPLQLVHLLLADLLWIAVVLFGATALGQLPARHAILSEPAGWREAAAGGPER